MMQNSLTEREKQAILPCPFCGGEAIIQTIEPHTHRWQARAEALERAIHEVKPCKLCVKRKSCRRTQCLGDSKPGFVLDLTRFEGGV